MERSDRITLETEIPPMPTEMVPKPNEDKYERDNKILEDKLSRLRGQLRGLIQTMKEKREGGRIEAMDTSAKEALQSKAATKKEMIAEKQGMISEYKKLREDFFKMRDQQQTIRNNLTEFSLEKVEAKIKELERTIETTTINNIQEEKKIIAEISKLQKSKPMLVQFNKRSKQMDANKARQEVLKKQMDAITGNINGTSTEIEGMQKGMRINRDKLKEEMPALQEEKKELETQVKALEDQKQTLFNKFKDQQRAYRKQDKLIKHIQLVTRIKKRLMEEEEKRKKREEQEKFEEENKPHPYEKEINQCEAYISYLEKYLPKEDETKEEKKAFTSQAEGTYMPSKQERIAQDMWFAPQKPKKGKKQRVRGKKETDALPTLPVEMLNFFSYHGIKVPTKVEEVAEALGELDKLVQEYEQKEEREDTPTEEEKKDNKQKEKPKPPPMDFPEPKESEVVVEYGIFEDSGPTSLPSAAPPKKQSRN